MNIVLGKRPSCSAMCKLVQMHLRRGMRDDEPLMRPPEDIPIGSSRSLSNYTGLRTAEGHRLEYCGQQVYESAVDIEEQVLSVLQDDLIIFLLCPQSV